MIPENEYSRLPDDIPLADIDLKYFAEDILEYEGAYYTLSETKMPFKADKTVDDDYFILTLFTLVQEARKKNINLTGKDVVLGVGLPPADFGQQAVGF